jgi:hypothetical protein
MFLFKYIKYILNCIEKVILPVNKGSQQRVLCHLPIKAVGKKNPLPPANKDSRQRISVLKKLKQLCHLPKKIKKSLCRLSRGSRQTGCAPSSHNGVRLLC